MNIEKLNIKSLLFDNYGIKQTIFKNTFWLGVGLGMSSLLKFVLLIYVARELGATEYGKFNFALAFISLFVIFHDLGLSSIVIREFSREKERKKEFSAILSLKILLSLGTLILVLIGSFFITPDSTVRKAILILALFSLIYSFTAIIYAFFHARQRMEYEAWAEVLQTTLLTGIGFFVILNFPSIINLSYAYLLSALIGLISVLIFFHFKFFPLRIFWQGSIWRKFLTMSWPLALTGLFGMIYNYIDSVMMGYWGQITETGWYNASYKIVLIASIPMGLISCSFYPVLSKFFKESKEKFQDVWHYNLQIMILLAIPLMVAGATLAPRIIKVIYGESFFPSIFAFQILIIMGGIIFFLKPFYDVLIISNQQRKIFWVALLGAVINVILNLILIPRFSLYGAAIATVVTYILIFLLYFKFTLKFTSVRPIGSRIFLTSFGAILSSFLMYFVISQPQIYNLNIFFSIPIGALIYFVVFFSLKFGAKQLTNILSHKPI